MHFLKSRGESWSSRLTLCLSIGQVVVVRKKERTVGTQSVRPSQNALCKTETYLLPTRFAFGNSEFSQRRHMGGNDLGYARFRALMVFMHELEITKATQSIIWVLLTSNFPLYIWLRASQGPSVSSEQYSHEMFLKV